MFIRYGTKAKQLAKEPISGKCPHCSSQNSIDMYVFQKYGHLYWIPFAPMTKTGVSECTHCKQKLELFQMPDQLKAKYEDIKARTKTPLWTFSGLLLLGVVIVLSILAAINDNHKNNQLILQPQAGDIYEMATENSQYTLLKVARVQGDSVYVHINEYETNKQSRLYQLKEKPFSAEEISFTKQTLRLMLKEGKILDVDR
jgi:hypothetical protein